MKVCSICKVAKPLDCFFKHRRTKDGHAYLCKECFAARYKSGAWKKNRNLARENANRKRRYADVTGEVVRARLRASYEKNKERHRVWAKASYAKHLAKRMLEAARARASALNIEFDLVLADIIIPEQCPVLGIPLRVNQGRAQDSSPSIDRMNNLRGYTRNNICIISWRANRFKSDASIEDLAKILAYMKANATEPQALSA